jgi:hypothetical protein
MGNGIRSVAAACAVLVGSAGDVQEGFVPLSGGGSTRASPRGRVWSAREKEIALQTVFREKFEG